MNKNLIIIIGIVIIVAIAGGYYFLNQKTASDQMMQKDTMMEKNDSEVMMDKATNSRYVEYSKDVLDKASSNRRVLFFFANWCPTCRPTDANFQANKSKIPHDVIVIRVNYSDSDTDQQEKDLANKYAVTYQHTFVQIDEEGTQIKKWNGGQLEELLANLQ